jgi:SM-20-related protein
MPAFIGQPECGALGAEIRDMRDAGTLRAARVGHGEARQVRPEIRADSIHWFDGESVSAPQRAAWESLDALRVGLNRRLFLGLTGLETHLTAYGSGTAYTKHVDNMRGSTRRLVSCVVYLNPAWCEAHGGQLRLYERADHDLVARDVDPLSGTLACFLSAEIAHEVLPTTHERLSVTGWFLGQPRDG